ncbi:MAG: BON domain-containing protein, partial [Acidobacteria bacterium]|nr:BON domain-containing protein [Acidobacteriota bacterium]
GKDYGYEIPLSEELRKTERKLGPPALVHIPGMWARSGGNRMRLSDHNEAAAPAPRQLTPEELLQRRVSERLLALPGYGVFDHMTFAITGHTVFLLGQVANPDLKAEAERQVSGLEGVGQVNNQITVLPSSPVDERIRQAEYKAIYEQPVLAKYATRAAPPIHIIVNQGHVVLAGTVADEAERNLAGEQARSVPGVVSVTNDLSLEQPGA